MNTLETSMTDLDIDCMIAIQAGQIERALRGGGTAGRDISGASARADALPSRTEVAMPVFKCCVCGRNYNEVGQYVVVPPWAEPELWSHGYCPTCFADALADAEKAGVA